MRAGEPYQHYSPHMLDVVYLVILTFALVVLLILGVLFV